MTRLDRIRRAKPSHPKIVLLTGLLVFAAVGGAAWAAKSGEVEGPKVDHARTVTFSPDESLDVAAAHELFTIGGSTVFAQCWAETDGGTGAAMAVMPGPDGAVVVNFDEASLVVGPNQPTPFIEFAVGPGAANGHKRSFAVFDGGFDSAPVGASASGTAALFADDLNERCVATAQAAG